MRELDQDSSAARAATNDAGARKRHPWTAPNVEDLPPLTDLTLATGGGIPGSASPASEGTVF
jgi:hypothetical protein